MKYGSLQYTNRKSKKIRNFKGGADLNSLPTEIADNSFSELQNMWYDGGVIKTRPGLYAASDSIIKGDELPYECEISYSVDGGIFNIGGFKKIAVENSVVSDSHYFCNIFFIDINGNKTAAGNFSFNRITDDEFYNPVHILFFTANPVNGAGLFALVSTKNVHNESMKSYRLYELNGNMTSWEQHTQFYTPIVYINGRGNRYEESKLTGLAFTGAPKVLEAPNMLTGSFKAYFTSDGKSSCFRLPYSNLKNETVICRVYSGADSYTEWVVQSDTVSAASTFYSAEITLTVDRSKGIIYFTDTDGDYPIPIMKTYPENNIRIVANKEFGGSFGKAASCNLNARFGTKNIFSGGSEKGEVYSVSVENPLYFPINSSVTAGGEDSEITALLSCKNTVLAFKENSVYGISVKSGSKINSNSLLADDDSVFYNFDTFDVKRICLGVGSVSPDTCILSGGNAIWLGSDKRIYTMNTVSDKAEAFLGATEYLKQFTHTEIKNSTSLDYKGHYILLIGKKAVIIDHGEDFKPNSPCYFWNFGNTEILGGFSLSDKIRLICFNSDNNILYSAELQGNKDTEISLVDSVCKTVGKNISSTLTTKHFDLGSMSSEKTVDSIFLALSSDGEVNISANGKHLEKVRLNIPDLDSTCGTLKSVKLIPHLTPLRELYITLSSENGFSLGELIINYRELF